MRDKTGPDRTRRSLLKAAAITRERSPARGARRRRKSRRAAIITATCRRHSRRIIQVLSAARCPTSAVPAVPTSAVPAVPTSALRALPGVVVPAVQGAAGPHGGGRPGGRGAAAAGTTLSASFAARESGYRPIETLVGGDRVAARFAGCAVIGRIDSFTLCRSGLRREWLGPSRPVRVRRGALGEDVPAEDLCLTASHCVFVDGFLVPVGNLVNGTSIVFEAADGRDTLDFFHIELANHDVLDAAGAPCESLRHPLAKPCVPLLGFHGGRSELRSRLRSAASLVIDRRQPIDIIRDMLEERGLSLARAA
jgi:hypothetical protein